METSYTTNGQPNAPLRLLGIWAHPDDEAYLSAGLMARTVAAGGAVTLVTISDGEAGFPAGDPRCKIDRAMQRRGELRDAMAPIGVDDMRFLGVPDGAVAEASPVEIVDQLIAIIHEVQPDVIVTFGPDGITGHGDHVATWTLATKAWLLSDIGELWYSAKTTTWLDHWRHLHDDFGIWMTEEPVGVHRDEIELVVDLTGAELEQKRVVLAGHASQTRPVAALFGEDDYREWIKEETFRRPSVEELFAASGAPHLVATGVGS